MAASPEAARLGLLLAAESSGALVAAEMTYAGVPWRAEVHEALLAELLGPRPLRDARPQKLDELVAEVRAALRRPRPQPRLPARPDGGAAPGRASRCPTSGPPRCARSTTRRIEPLLRYKQLAHLFQTNGWAWLDQWVSDGRFRPSYQPAGSTTGRWSSNGGGALSFPAQVRPAAVADEGWVLVVADVAQLEPRVLAGMSRDGALARAARGADLYQGMVDDGAVATRQDAKLGLLGAMYGATSGESGRMVAGLTRRYPAAFGLVEEAARAGERGQVVRTLLGRGSPGLGEAWHHDPDDPPADPDSRPGDRRAYGRFTRNFVVQGTGAEWALCWIADLRNRLWRLGGTGALDERPTWSSSSTTRSSCTRRPRSPTTSPRRREAARRGGPALPRPRHRLPAQHLGRPVLRRQAGNVGSSTAAQAAPSSATVGKRPSGSGRQARRSTSAAAGEPTNSRGPR